MSYWAKITAICITMATLSLSPGIFSDSGNPSASAELGDQPLYVDKRQSTIDCKQPCNCTQEPLCKAGVNIIEDGCGCCPMCARQQGDLCNAKDKCDEEKGLYCHATASDFRGTCRAKQGKSCVVDGKEYPDGMHFQPNCSLLCTCQDGKYACSSKCPQELRQPSSVHCRDSHLVAIKDRCCKEWVCPHQHSIIDREFNGTQSNGCPRETTDWSACSVTCGFGESIRVTTTENGGCKPIQERRLCITRPCDMENLLPPDKKCRSTYRAPPQKIRHDNCESEEELSLKYCMNCKRNKCCTSTKSNTVPVSFRCPDQKQVTKLVMINEACRCFRHKVCPN